MKTNKGFTLIELLVVIAIIGILSSVVLASLNTARGKGSDAAIKANLSNARAQAELFYDGNNNEYGPNATLTVGAGVCNATLPNNIAASVTAAGTGATCAASQTAWVAKASLSGTNGTFCVDSTGFAATTSNTVNNEMCN
jgi:prepilin-type N-terminal cleavage/methylation domain-containing protein